MRLTLSAMSLPVLALGAFMMQATPVFAQAAAPTTGPTSAPATTPPVTTPSPAANGLPSASTAPTMTAPSTGTSSTSKATRRMSMDARFKAANTSNDGNLTLDQAKAANWSYVTKNFSAIDKGSKGYVTMADIHGFAKARRVAHHHSSTAASGSTGAANPPAALNPPPMSPQ